MTRTSLLFLLATGLLPTRTGLWPLGHFHSASVGDSFGHFIGFVLGGALYLQFSAYPGIECGACR